MTRNEFMTRLRRGLVGLDPDYIRDVMNDYESHFEDGIQSGRSEQEVAAALGDPSRLARELRAEQGFRRWEEEKSPGSLAGVVLALVGLATVDVMLLLPFLGGLAAVMLVFGLLAVGLTIGGIVVLVAALIPGWVHHGLQGGTIATGLVGVGLVSGGVGLTALFWLAVEFIARLLVRYARLHFKLIDAVSA